LKFIFLKKLLFSKQTGVKSEIYSHTWVESFCYCVLSGNDFFSFQLGSSLASYSILKWKCGVQEITSSILLVVFLSHFKEKNYKGRGGARIKK